MTSRLVVKELTKRYNSFKALGPVSFALDAGQITVLSGPNGSGKTTLLSCLSGLVRPSSGTVTIDGFDLYRDEIEVRRRLAFVPDVPKFYLELTAWEHLQFVAMANNDLQNFEVKAELLLNKLSLWEVKDYFPHYFSRGMRLRLGLALALIRPFDVLVLDEPTSALDADGVRLFSNELRELRIQGKTILMSTHDIGLMDQLADRFFKLEKGMLETR